MANIGDIIAIHEALGSSGGNGVLMVNVTTTEEDGALIHTCDKTAGEMLAAMQSGVVIIKPFTNKDGYTVGGPVAGSSHASAGYCFYLSAYYADAKFIADSADGYPFDIEGGK